MPEHSRFEDGSRAFSECKEHILAELSSVSEYAARIDLVNDACVMLQELGIHVDLHDRSVEQCIVEAQLRDAGVL